MGEKETGMRVGLLDETGHPDVYFDFPFFLFSLVRIVLVGLHLENAL